MTASGYTTRDVARIFDLEPDRVRRYVRSRVVEPERGPRNEYRFTFQDLVLLQTAIELESARVPARRIHSALRELRDQIPGDRPLTGVRIQAEGNRVVVDDGRARWNPASGQVQLDFSLSDMALRVARLEVSPAEPDITGNEPAAEDWYELALGHEDDSPLIAQELYRRAIEADPGHADARVNLGCLLHEAGRLEEAREQYARALAASPDHPTAAFDLGVVLEDMGRDDEAVEAYARAVEVDPRMADAYYNLSQLCEAAGDRASALRHLRSYRDLTRAN